MQSGKIYVKGNFWWFRYQEPSGPSKRRWQDKYERLAPAKDYESAKQVEKEFGSRIREILAEVAVLNTGMMQPVSDFVDKAYFPGKQDALRPSTLDGYKHLWKRHLKPRFQNLRMMDVRLPVAQQILDDVAQKHPHVSSGLLQHLKWLGVAIFDYAAQQEAFDPERKNPFAKVTIPATHPIKKPTRYATLDDVVAMINALDEPAATVVALAAFSGLRKSEIQGLCWEDLKRNELHVRRSAWRPTHVIEETKTAASRAAVPVIPVLTKYLAAHRNGLPTEGFVFAGAKSKHPLNLNNLARRDICPTLKAADIPWCGWHGFRRGLATTLYQLGVDGKTRQAILRHANIAVTENVYTKPVSKISKAAMNKVQRAFSARLKKAKQR